MLDQIEHKIARNLAEHHLYPFGMEIYMNIFKRFSHFPILLEDLKINGPGISIAYIPFVVLRCFDQDKSDFLNLYKKILQEMKDSPVAKLRYNLAVETYLGCVLYFYHPIDIKNILSSIDVKEIFNDKERYEYEIKKKTVLLFTI